MDMLGGFFVIAVGGGFFALGASSVVAEPEKALTVTVFPSIADCKSRTGNLLADATRQIERGDTTCAREILLTPQATKSAPMTFLLAETYDPNMLAAWQIRGLGNIEKAKALYEKARKVGHPEAQLRVNRLFDN